jgi:hypothetical protein
MSTVALPPDVVELWWCPVCGAAAHRTWRAGRPKIYCSNACRQRAYRWRRDNCARTIARPSAPALGAFVASGRKHALRTPRDFVGRPCDAHGRRTTVCGVRAKPWSLLRNRTHHNFVEELSDACRTCGRLVAPLLDPDAPASLGLGGAPDRRAQRAFEAMRRTRQPDAERFRPGPEWDSPAYMPGDEPHHERGAVAGLVRLARP